MFNFGSPELLILLAIVIIIFGASRIPQLGSALGKGIQNFRKSLKGEEKKIEDNSRETEDQKPDN